MVFPHKQGGFLAWLQSDIYDFSLFLKQPDQGHIKVAEQVDLSNANDEEAMTNLWSDNQGAGSATKDHLDCESDVGEAYDKDWCSFMESVNRIISTDALIQPFPQQPYYSPTVDFSAYKVEIVPDNEQQMHHASRDEQLLFANNIPLTELEWNKLKELEWSKLEEMQKVIFNDKDNNSEIPGGAQYNVLYADGVPLMFEDDQGGKEFSSWIIYDDSNDIVTFKNVPSEGASEDSPQSIASTHNKSSPIAKMQRVVFNDKDNKSEIPGVSQYDVFYADGVPLMFEDDQGSKGFSSWLIYGDSNNIVTFKHVPSEGASEDSPQSIVSTHSKSSPIAKPNQDSHDKSAEEQHAVCESGTQANGASSSEKSKNSTAGNRLSTRSLSNRGTMLYHSHLQPRQTLLFDYSDLFHAGSSM